MLTIVEKNETINRIKEIDETIKNLYGQKKFKILNDTNTILNDLQTQKQKLEKNIKLTQTQISKIQKEDDIIINDNIKKMTFEINIINKKLRIIDNNKIDKTIKKYYELIDVHEDCDVYFLNENDYYIEKISCGLKHVIGLFKNGNIVCWGNNDYNQCKISDSYPFNMTINSNFSDIAAGLNHSVGIMNDKIVCWGNNEYKQCDNNDNITDKIIRVSCSNFSSVLDKKSNLKIWGYHEYNSINDFRNIENLDYELTNITKNNKIKDVAVGYDHIVILLQDGTIKCIGNNTYSQAIREINDLDNVKNIYANKYFSIAVLVNGKVKCWGHKNITDIFPPKYLSITPIKYTDVIKLINKNDGSIYSIDKMNNYWLIHRNNNSNFAYIINDFRIMKRINDNNLFINNMYNNNQDNRILNFEYIRKSIFNVPNIETYTFIQGNYISQYINKYIKNLVNICEYNNDIMMYKFILYYVNYLYTLNVDDYISMKHNDIIIKDLIFDKTISKILKYDTKVFHNDILKIQIEIQQTINNHSINLEQNKKLMTPISIFNKLTNNEYSKNKEMIANVINDFNSSNNINISFILTNLLTFIKFNEANSDINLVDKIKMFMYILYSVNLYDDYSVIYYDYFRILLNLKSYFIKTEYELISDIKLHKIIVLKLCQEYINDTIFSDLTMGYIVKILDDKLDNTINIDEFYLNWFSYGNVELYDRIRRMNIYITNAEREGIIDDIQYMNININIEDKFLYLYYYTKYFAEYSKIFIFEYARQTIKISNITSSDCADNVMLNLIHMFITDINTGLPDVNKLPYTVRPNITENDLIIFGLSRESRLNIMRFRNSDTGSRVIAYFTSYIGKNDVELRAHIINNATRNLWSRAVGLYDNYRDEINLVQNLYYFLNPKWYTSGLQCENLLSNNYVNKFPNNNELNFYNGHTIIRFETRAQYCLHVLISILGINIRQIPDNNYDECDVNLINFQTIHYELLQYVPGGVPGGIPVSVSESNYIYYIEYDKCINNILKIFKYFNVQLPNVDVLDRNIDTIIANRIPINRNVDIGIIGNWKFTINAHHAFINANNDNMLINRYLAHRNMNDEIMINKYLAYDYCMSFFNENNYFDQLNYITNKCTTIDLYNICLLFMYTCNSNNYVYLLDIVNMANHDFIKKLISDKNIAVNTNNYNNFFSLLREIIKSTIPINKISVKNFYNLIYKEFDFYKYNNTTYLNRLLNKYKFNIYSINDIFNDFQLTIPANIGNYEFYTDEFVENSEFKSITNKIVSSIFFQNNDNRTKIVSEFYTVLNSLLINYCELANKNILGDKVLKESLKIDIKLVLKGGNCIRILLNSLGLKEYENINNLLSISDFDFNVYLCFNDMNIIDIYKRYMHQPNIYINDEKNTNICNIIDRHYLNIKKISVMVFTLLKQYIDNNKYLFIPNINNITIINKNIEHKLFEYVDTLYFESYDSNYISYNLMKYGVNDYGPKIVTSENVYGHTLTYSKSNNIIGSNNMVVDTSYFSNNYIHNIDLTLKRSQTLIKVMHNVNNFDLIRLLYNFPTNEKKYILLTPYRKKLIINDKSYILCDEVLQINEPIRNIKLLNATNQIVDINIPANMKINFIEINHYWTRLNININNVCYNVLITYDVKLHYIYDIAINYSNYDRIPMTTNINEIKFNLKYIDTLQDIFNVNLSTFSINVPNLKINHYIRGIKHTINYVYNGNHNLNFTSIGNIATNHITRLKDVTGELFDVAIIKEPLYIDKTETNSKHLKLHLTDGGKNYSNISIYSINNIIFEIENIFFTLIDPWNYKKYEKNIERLLTFIEIKNIFDFIDFNINNNKFINVNKNKINQINNVEKEKETPMKNFNLLFNTINLLNNEEKTNYVIDYLRHNYISTNTTNEINLIVIKLLKNNNLNYIKIICEIINKNQIFMLNIINNNEIFYEISKNIYKLKILLFECLEFLNDNIDIFKKLITNNEHFKGILKNTDLVNKIKDKHNIKFHILSNYYNEVINNYINRANLKKINNKFQEYNELIVKYDNEKFIDFISDYFNDNNDNISFINKDNEINNEAIIKLNSSNDLKMLTHKYKNFTFNLFDINFTHNNHHHDKKIYNFIIFKMIQSIVYKYKDTEKDNNYILRHCFTLINKIYTNKNIREPNYKYDSKYKIHNFITSFCKQYETINKNFTNFSNEQKQFMYNKYNEKLVDVDMF
jgi:alpha-tubulin suppressor-like RCC1 family protein